MSSFNEDNTIEQLTIVALGAVGWRYVAPEDLNREQSDVLVESMLKDALISLNPEIKEDVSRADEVIYKIRRSIINFFE